MLKIDTAPKTQAPEPCGPASVPYVMPTFESEALAKAEYEASSRTLFVQFASGEWYAYLDVPQLVFHDLLGAESKGGFFQEAIRDSYTHVRLSPVPE